MNENFKFKETKENLTELTFNLYIYSYILFLRLSLIR